MTMGRIVGLALAGITSLVVLLQVGRIFENVDAGEIVVIQDPYDGELHWYTQPGVVMQNFGKVTVYQRRGTYEFNNLGITFNDAGTATLQGSVQYDMPLDEKNLTALHTRYGSPEAIKANVIQKTVDKVVYMTGPLLSSRESYAEKKTNLIEWAQDQITNGVYKVVQNTVEATDPISGEKRSAIVAAIALKAEAPAGRDRQEQSVVGEFGIHAFNFAVTHVEYSPEVKAQIATQQMIIQNVQKAIAQAREAEQQKITTEQQGQAEAAKTKWAQEAMNAQIVAEAEGRKRAAEQDALAAEAEKRATLSRASGEAEARRLKMAADGALEQKLAAWTEVNTQYAAAIKGYQGNWVPTTVLGGGGESMNGAQSLINMLMVKTAKELAVDMTPGGK